MYATTNYKTKAALKNAVKSGERIGIFAPGIGEAPTNGRAYLEGPHYPEPHRWYAQVEVKDGAIVKVT